MLSPPCFTLRMVMSSKKWSFGLNKYVNEIFNETAGLLSCGGFQDKTEMSKKFYRLYDGDADIP